ncbi:hydroxymethylbilane synthase [Mariniblastus fucicola]|uniref:Porphobilinogen deaminase n=1 Tax=Mariniblastus fucicola TaxID=980251 RepID=A0A5B9PEN0_9BACT|nr:hydroxymethylbilane synthase [Mariniblastus fucicola]QEG23655.1 Porphobilinogen deaminase [Mariniblastus fucicola]
MSSTPQTIRLGTRGSKLAMWQSNWVKAELEKLGNVVELIQIKTQGDVQTGPLAQIGGQGLFTKQLQVALDAKEIDLAVHSLKDLPTEDADGLSITAIPPRETTEDAICGPVGSTLNSLESLPQKAIVGTGSVRRAAQILNLRPDLDIRDIRGNVDTRLAKLDSGEFDVIVLAAAGLTRLGLADRISFRFDRNVLLPAVGQGALGLETRADDEATVAAVAKLNHPESFSSALAERAMLRRLFAGCLAPVGARCDITGTTLTLTGVVLSRDGKIRTEASDSAPLNDYELLGISVAEKLIAAGADKLLAAAKSEP